jgi:hypothetical protein
MTTTTRIDNGLEKLSQAVNWRENCRVDLIDSIANLPANRRPGRNRKNISVINIIDTLRRHTRIKDAANYLGVSRGYIYERVKNPREYLARERTS